MRVAHAARGLILGVLILPSVVACRLGPTAPPSTSESRSETPTVYEQYTGALTATAAAQEAAPSLEPTASANGDAQQPYPFEVVYRDFGGLPDAGYTAFGRLFALTPDTPETRAQVWLNDLSTFWGLWERAGIERPTSKDGPNAYESRMAEVTSVLRDSGIGILPRPNGIAWMAGLGDDGHFTNVDFSPYAGIDAREAEATLRSGKGWSVGFMDTPETLEIVLGRYDANAIGGAITNCDGCVSSVTVQYAGVPYMAWGDDFESGSRERQMSGPFFDFFGRGGRVAIFNGTIYRALSNDGIHQLIDARSGQLPNLAQDEDYRLAANGLAALDAYSAIVSSADFSLTGLMSNLRSICIRPNKGGAGIPPDQGTPHSSACSTWDGPGFDGLAVAETSPLMRRFEVAAFGTAWDPERAAIDSVIVLVHQNESDAQENVGLLLRRLAETRVPDGVTLYADEIGRVEIGTVGRLLLAKVTRNNDSRLEITYLEPGMAVHIPPAIHD